MKSFLRSDGRSLAVIEGLRERVLSDRPSVSPREGWNDDQFAASARKKLRRFQRMLASFRRWVPTLDGARILDVGCGDGANCTLLATELGCLAVGIDLHLPRFAPDAAGQRTRRLLDGIAEARTRSEHVDAAVRSKGRACFVEMDATCPGFRPGSFDVVLSRSAAEHIRPIGRALVEIERAVRPGGLIYLGIDPFYWLRGCHKRAVVDIPFAHARLSLEEYRHFVAMNEGETAATKRWGRLETLNRLTIRQWRETIEPMSCEILEWREGRSELGEAVLRENPDVLETLLPGVEESDLLTDRIEVWLRKR